MLTDVLMKCHETLLRYYRHSQYRVEDDHKFINVGQNTFGRFLLSIDIAGALTIMLFPFFLSFFLFYFLSLFENRVTEHQATLIQVSHFSRCDILKCAYTFLVTFVDFCYIY